MSSDEIERRQQERDDYLVTLYELSGGDLFNWPTHRAIAQASGIQEDRVFEVGQLVSGRGFSKFQTMGGLDGMVSITAGGVDRAESLITSRREKGLPAASSYVVLSDAELLPKLETLVRLIRDEFESDTSIDAELRPDIEADIQSTNDQLRANRPNRDVIKASLGRIQKIWPRVVELAVVGSSITNILHSLG
jgi:hypothetical protein